MEKFFIELVGFAAIFLAIVMYQQNDRKKLIFFKLLIDILWVVHYLPLNRYTIVLTSCINILREFVFYNKEKPFFKSRIWVALFIGAYAVSPILTWRDIFSIFPPISSIITSIALWCDSVKRTKIISLCVAISQLVYGISANSLANISNEILSISSIIVSFIRNRFKNKKSMQEG